MKPLVHNAADEGQVKEAAGKERRGRDREISDLRTVLELTEGRRLMQRLLHVCGVSSSVWHASALIHYRSGAQDVGHYLIKEILEANPGLGASMLADAYREVCKGEE